MTLSFPEPTEDAKVHSLQLQALLKKLIQQYHKISFHDYMQRVLYEPGLGYYSAGSCKLGAAGDFITAPEISTLFGISIAQQLVPVLQTLKNCDCLELGAGSGKLACAILLQLAQQQCLPEHYYILEVSADLKQRQQSYLKAALPDALFTKIVWLDALPQALRGIIIANEVLDALPVYRFHVNSEGLIQEYFIGLDAKGDLIELLDMPSSDYLTKRIQQLNLDGAYSSEINLQQEALLKALNDSLDTGLILFIDYGFPAKEFYHPDRNQGTLMCHYQHRAHTDVLFWPGLQDITAHVDFTALARVGIELGLSLLTFATQAVWLLHADICAHAEKQWALLSDGAKLLAKKALHKLIAPEEMGELFKFIVFGKNITGLDIMPALWDMRHRL